MRFVLLSSHSQGYTPLAIKNLLAEFFHEKEISSHEMLITAESGVLLPSGAAGFASRGFGVFEPKSL